MLVAYQGTIWWLWWLPRCELAVTTKGRVGGYHGLSWGELRVTKGQVGNYRGACWRRDELVVTMGSSWLVYMVTSSW